MKELNEENSSGPMNTIVIVFDQAIPYHNLPKSFTDRLLGYQSFKKRSIEFTNMYNNRQDCSPARSVMNSGIINTGIQDDISLEFQYKYLTHLDYDVNTPAKTYHRNDPNSLTGYYGKQHLDGKLTYDGVIYPSFASASHGSMKAYGYDKFNLLGDTAEDLGIQGDQKTFNSIVAPLSDTYDIIDCDGTKRQGLIPFLEARKKDKKSFFVQYNSVNPHDTMQFWQRPTRVPKPACSQAPFVFPFYKEQGAGDIFKFNEEYEDAWVDHTNLTTNFFEKTFEEYSSNFASMPFKQSYKEGYINETDVNGIFPWLYGMYDSLDFLFTMPVNSSDLASWKNLINNYYGLMFEVDFYLYRLYKFLKCNDMLDNTNVIVTGDHGEMLSSHGLKEKGFHYENSVKVPLLISSPLNKKLWGTKSDILCSHIDLNPTIEHISLLTNKSVYDGVSLFDSNFNVRTVNSKVLNIMLSSMYLTPCYMSWCGAYKNMSPENRLRVYRKPTNIFEFYYSFIQNITVIDGVKWKWVRFFSVRDIIFENNLAFVLKSEVIAANLDNMRFQGSLKQQVLDRLPSSFSFSTFFNTFKNDITSPAFPFLESDDRPILYTYMILMSNYINYKNERIIDIPGNNNNYELNITRYPYFCYNLTEDPNEIVNLADPSRPQLPIFRELDDEIVRMTDRYARRFRSAVPSIMFENLLKGAISAMIEYNLGNIDIENLRKNFAMNYGMLAPVFNYIS